MIAIIAQVVQHTQAHRHTGRARKGKGARFGDEWVSCLENPVGNLSINATTNPLSASPSLLNLHQLFHELSAFVPEIWSKASGILWSLPRRRMRDKIFVWRALSFQRETDPRQNFSNPDSSLLICRQMSKPSSVTCDFKQLSPYNLHWALYKKSNRENSINQGSPCLLSCFEEITMAMKTH